MIVRIEQGGTSFVGAGRYYLHDKAADKTLPAHLKPDTDERVWFTETLNTFSTDPEQALVEMWKTAEDQAWLKQQAGVRASGRHTAHPVKTLSLSWHKDDAPAPDHMIATAKDFLKTMGWDGHQALLIGHRDTEHRHIHIVLNRIHPETGRTLNDYKEQRAAQSWAARYEREHGPVRCELREVNTQRREAFAEAKRQAARQAGQQPRPEADAADIAKHTAKAAPAPERPLPQPANDHLPHNVVMFTRPKQRQFSAEDAQRETIDRQTRDLLKTHQRQQREAWFKDGAKLFKATRHAVYDQVRAEMRPEWQAFHKDLQRARAEAARASGSALGRANWFAREGRWGEARAAFSDRNAVAKAVETTFNLRRAELHRRQQDTTRQRQDMVLDRLREARGAEYQALLEGQRAERAEFKGIDVAPTSREMIATRARTLVTQAMIGAQGPAANADIPPLTPAAANANIGPIAHVEAAVGAANASPPVTQPDSPTLAAIPATDIVSAASHASDRTPASPAEWKSIPATSQTGTPLADTARLLAAIPATSHSEIVLAGLALHHAYGGSDAARTVFSDWASRHPAWQPTAAEALWSSIDANTSNAAGLPLLAAIARNHGIDAAALAIETLEPTSISEKGDQHKPAADSDANRDLPPRRGATDLAAGALGAVAGYLADQIGEALAPTPPEERTARALLEARRDAERPTETPRDEASRYARTIQAAIDAAERERQEGRSRDYWTDRDRRKDYERDR